MISREEALVVLKKYIQDKKTIHKSILTELILRDLSKRLNEDENLWGLTGLLHNIDYEYTEENLQERGNLSSKILTGLIPKEGINAIKGLNYKHTKYLPIESLDKALISTTSLTDLLLKILEYDLNESKLEYKASFLYERYKDQSFAPKVDRNRIKVIEDIGFTIEEFLKISVNYLNDISKQIII